MIIKAAFWIFTKKLSKIYLKRIKLNIDQLSH
jgi:hypothetical protein